MYSRSFAHDVMDDQPSPAGLHVYHHHQSERIGCRTVGSRRTDLDSELDPRRSPGGEDSGSRSTSVTTRGAAGAVWSMVSLARPRCVILYREQG